MTDSNLKNIAIVGAGGNSGSYMVAEILKTGKHYVTALTREDSSNVLPEGFAVKKIDYDDPRSIVAALDGQDVLIITLSVTTPKDVQQKLVEAAIQAKVQYVMPNHWAPDSEDEGLAKDVVNFGQLKKFQEWLGGQMNIKHLSLSCGFWYEWSLAIPDAYGFDLENKTATFFDDGLTLISTSTWPQVGRAVASLLSLPVPELDKLSNKLIYVNSFTLSQQDMLESILRVTGDKEEDWKVVKQASKERYEKGIESMQKGDRTGFVHMMYTRVFYKDDSGNFEQTRGTVNRLLELPKEDLDEATKRAIQRARDHPFRMRH